jgi:acetyl esterase/lipase
MDITAPTSGGPWPLMVFLPGGPSPPDERYAYVLDPFAKALAGQGAVVMVAGWREGPQWGGGYPTSFADVACAIGVAREIGPSYGANPDRVTLVGHSTGGWPAAVVGLTPSSFTPAHGSCDPTAGSLSPDQVVSMDGVINEVSEPDVGDGPEYVSHFLGGSRRAHPHAWEASDPFALAQRYPAGAHAIPFLLIHGVLDNTVYPRVSRLFQAALVTAGYHSRLVRVPDAGHIETLGNGDVVVALMTFMTEK